MRVAHFIGDFGNPFYTEERQRDVWNEASAFGLQVAVWLTLIASMVTVWLVGRPAVPYVLAAVGLIGLVCLLTIAYAQRLGVSVTTTQRVLRLRLIPYLLVVAGLLVGVARSAGGYSVSFVIGTAMGAVVAIGTTAVLGRRHRSP